KAGPAWRYAAGGKRDRCNIAFALETEPGHCARAKHDVEPKRRASVRVDCQGPCVQEEVRVGRGGSLRQRAQTDRNECEREPDGKHLHTLIPLKNGSWAG